MHTKLSLREAVCQSENLSSAWARFRCRRGMWKPGMSMWQTAADPVGPMLRLAEELRVGRYRPSPPQVVSIAKADGGRRELRIYAIRDRLAQRAVLQVLQARTDPVMSRFSFGYRPGRGVSDALVSVRAFLASGLSWVIDADIERCFDSIPRDRLLQEVALRLDDDSAAGLVAEVMGWHDAEARTDVGISQGSVLSPWLCNVYLWRLDDYMQENFTAMVRYADDFLLLAQSASLAEQSRADCALFLAVALRLRLHPLKTVVVGPGTRFHFLGNWLETACVQSVRSAIA